MYNHTCRYLYSTVYRHDKRIQMVVVRATNGFGSGVRILTERVVHRNRIFCRGGRFFFYTTTILRHISYGVLIQTVFFFNQNCQLCFAWISIAVPCDWSKTSWQPLKIRITKHEYGQCTVSERRDWKHFSKIVIR